MSRMLGRKPQKSTVASTLLSFPSVCDHLLYLFSRGLIWRRTGGTPKVTLAHGAVIEPRNLCTQSFLNVLCNIPHLEQEPTSSSSSVWHLKLEVSPRPRTKISLSSSNHSTPGFCKPLTPTNLAWSESCTTLP